MRIMLEYRYFVNEHLIYAGFFMFENVTLKPLITFQLKQLLLLCSFLQYFCVNLQNRSQITFSQPNFKLVFPGVLFH